MSEAIARVHTYAKKSTRARNRCPGSLGRLLVVIMVTLLSWATASANADHAVTPATEKLKKVLAGDHRSAANKARDKYRHPYETLMFFGIREDMTVVEIFPGGGWYTEILAPFLRDNGHYYAAGFDPASPVEFFRNGAKRFATKLAADPTLYNHTISTVLAPPAKTHIAPENSADMVLTFRNVHNWMAQGSTETVFAAMFRALKPGGMLGLVEHRGISSAPQDPKATSGYVNQDYVINLAEKTGFTLLGTSEINANSKDSKDYPNGVWSLPPTLRTGEDGKNNYLEIGESDRMTLLFIKM